MNRLAQRYWTPAILLALLGVIGGIAGCGNLAQPMTTDPESPRTVLSSLQAAEPVSQASETQDPEQTVKLTSEQWRRKFPFVSVADRLHYEVGRRQGSSGTQAIKLTEASAKRLDALEHGDTARDQWNMRKRSLQMLHSDEVEKFIERDGFGERRMPAPSIRYLKLEESPPIWIPTFSELSAEFENGEPVPLPLATNGRNDLRMPSLDSLSAFHDNGRIDFLNPARFGLVKDRKQVAGFQSHQFGRTPELAPGTAKDQPQDRWQLRRLELVSLLKLEKPVVYLAEHLPRMEELKKADTRPLNNFETRALQALQKGEDLVTEATLNRIQMVGSVRATQACLECHQVQRGELLGSFSYELQRDPPLRVAN